MILVDSSVWSDYLRGVSTPQSNWLDSLLGVVPLAIGDLILTEVLQGCADDRHFNDVRRMLGSFEFVVLGGADMAVEAARNFRKPRLLGVTLRKTIDTVIATRCIVSGYELLHSDHDFDPFVARLGLKCVACND